MHNAYQNTLTSLFRLNVIFQVQSTIEVAYYRLEGPTLERSPTLLPKPKTVLVQDAETALGQAIRSVCVSSICNSPHRAPLRGLWPWPSFISPWSIRLAIFVPARTTRVVLKLVFFILLTPMIWTPTIVPLRGNVYVCIPADVTKCISACALVVVPMDVLRNSRATAVPSHMRLLVMVDARGRATAEAEGLVPATTERSPPLGLFVAEHCQNNHYRPGDQGDRDGDDNADDNDVASSEAGGMLRRGARSAAGRLRVCACSNFQCHCMPYHLNKAKDM